MRARPTSNANTFTQLTSEHCFVSLIPLYCKLTDISWLNDCEDMKLVVPTHVVPTQNTIALVAYIEDYSVKNFTILFALYYSINILYCYLYIFYLAFSQAFHQCLITINPIKYY